MCWAGRAEGRFTFPPSRVPFSEHARIDGGGEVPGRQDARPNDAALLDCYTDLVPDG